MFKSLFTSTLFLGSILFLSSSFQWSSIELNPTGTYEYDHGNKGEGIIKVHKISASTIKISLFVVGGSPSHNMGEFSDELTISNNVANYVSDDCSIKFEFSAQGVKVTQSGIDCGFGNGITANGFYGKKSSAVPKMEEEY
jgi:hypothetical protein